MTSRAGTTGSISRRAGGKLDVCQLAALLFREVDFMSLQRILVSECRVRWHQRKRYTRVQACLDTFWTAYSAGEMTSAQYVHGPARRV